MVIEELLRSDEKISIYYMSAKNVLGIYNGQQKIKTMGDHPHVFAIEAGLRYIDNMFYNLINTISISIIHLEFMVLLQCEV